MIRIVRMLKGRAKGYPTADGAHRA
jgi:hypothetical protein